MGGAVCVWIGFACMDTPDDVDEIREEIDEAEHALRELQAAAAHGYADRDVRDEIKTLQKRVHTLEQTLRQL